jgi:hypothetical protein
MNKSKFSIILAAALCLGGTGCQLLSGNGQDSASLQSDARLITYLGSALYLQKNPEYRVAFETTRTALEVVANDENASPASLAAALSNLPISEVRSGNGAILFHGGLLLIERFAGGGQNQIDPEQIQSVASGMRDGFNMALIQSQPAPGS